VRGFLAVHSAVALGTQAEVEAGGAA
jgi:hypothetical protein